MSVFAGIFPPAEAISHLSKVVDGLGLDRGMPSERWHVTVTFLGDADETAAAKAMDEARLYPLGELAIAGAGQFGAAVFWAGIAGDVDGLRRLSKHIRIAMRANRISPDDRPYNPHLTLARPRAVVLAPALETMRAYNGPFWRPAEVVLIRSEFGPQPAYHRLGAWALPPASAAKGGTGHE